MNNFSRFLKKYQWVTQTAAQLGGDTISKIKMLTGGFWLLITDTDKSKLAFKARINAFGKKAEILFEDVGDFGLLVEVFLSEPYPFKFNQAPKLIVDLGANIGISALYFFMKYPNAEIHCFEPDPLNLKRIKTLTAAYPNVTVHEMAAWSHSDTLTFYSDPHRGSSSSTIKIRARQKEIKVKAESLDTILDKFEGRPVDILKMDIEGAEEKVLKHCTQFDKIRNLVGEIHFDLCNGENVMRVIKQHFTKLHLEPFNAGKRFYVYAGNIARGN